MARPRPALAAGAVLLSLAVLITAALTPASGVEVLAKSRLKRCARDSGAGDRLSCDRKIVLDMAVPSGSSGGEASLVAQVEKVEDEDNNTQATKKTIRDPPVITVNKSATYALYDLTYIRDVAYKPEEQFVKTRKCEPDAGAKFVKSCERLRDQNGQIIEHTEPVCCDCGDQYRIPSSCGSIFKKIAKGKANTAYCLRFRDDWFHVFQIGTSSLWFTIKVQVKKGSSLSEVVVGPANRTVISKDNFLRVNLVGDFGGYTSFPSFEDFYLVTPRKHVGAGKPLVLGDDFSRWMLLERVRFTIDGLECDKIGVGYEAYRSQPNFCLSPFGSCLYNQLWNYWEDDKNRINNSQQPLYVVQGRFQSINQHPNAGVDTFSMGFKEVLNTNLLIELSADDVEYDYKRSPGNITNITCPSFEALSQVGTAKVTTKNIGKLEASYSLTLNCSSGINDMGEQFFTMKPDEVLIHSFDLQVSTVQASKYQCEAVLKASDFSELDRAKCHSSTKATILDNGTQIGSSPNHAKGGIWGFFEVINAFLHKMWGDLIYFLTGRSCSTRCSSYFDLSCHSQYICIIWFIMFVQLLVTLLRGLFYPFYAWWKDVFGLDDHNCVHLKHKKAHKQSHHHYHPYDPHKKRKSEPSHQHHHVLHRHSGQPDTEAETERHRWHSRHKVALGVQHRDGLHKHRHGKAVAALLPREMIDGGVEHKPWRHHEQHSSRHQFDHVHHHS